MKQLTRDGEVTSLYKEPRQVCAPADRLLIGDLQKQK